MRVNSLLLCVCVFLAVHGLQRKKYGEWMQFVVWFQKFWKQFTKIALRVSPDELFHDATQKWIRVGKNGYFPNGARIVLWENSVL